jgi:hypothetical protein
MRYYRPVIKQPISTFVEAPLDFIQGQMENEQKAIDLGREKALKANEEYLGLRAGMKSKDYLNQFKSQYDSQFNTLTQKMMQDPSQVGNIAEQISLLSNKMKQDPLYNAIRDDFEKSQEFTKKAVGSDKAYYMNNPNQLTMGPDGQYQMSTAQDYGILTSKDLYSKMFDDVSKFKPDEGTDKNGNKTYSLFNADGSVTTVNSITEFSRLRRDRIKLYLDDMFNTSNIDGTMEFEYRDAAEKAGNPAMAKDPAFRKKVFDAYAAPILQQAYEQEKTTTKIDEGNKARNTNANGGSGGVTPAKPDSITFTPVTTQIRMANYNKPGSEEPITTMSDFDESYKTIKNKRGEQALAFMDMYKQLTGKNLAVNPEAFSNLMYSRFKLNEDGKIVPKDLANLEDIKLASNELFEDAWLNLRDLNDTEQNIKAFESKIKKAAGVDKYDPKILKNAENKAKAEIYNSKGITSPLSEEAALERFNKLSKEEQQSLILKFKDKYEYQMKNNIPKNSPESKVYTILDSYNNRQEDVELRMLPNSNESVKNMAKAMLSNFSTDMASKFKDLVTNEEINGAKMLEKIPYKQGESNKGEIDFDKIQFGYYVDPNEGMKGVMEITGEGKYEYPITEGGLQQVVMTLIPQEQFRFNFYNQAVQSLQKNYGKGQVNINDETFPISFNFEETPSEIDPTKKNYTYTDENNISRRVNTIQDLQNAISSYYDKAVSIKNNPDNVKAINEIQRAVINGDLSPQKGNAGILKIISDADILAKKGFQNLGKQQPQVQGKTLGW